MGHRLTREIAERFAGIALGHVTREYPHKTGLVFAGLEDVRPPAAMHPVFHGSFDWHSCVHGYWLLARLLRAFPDLDRAGDIRTLFDRQLVPDKIAGECSTFDAPAARGFERPYGWAWLLKLAAELRDAEAPRWGKALSPLAERIAARFAAFLPIAPYPVRVGTHFNTAFALRLAADYTDADLFALLRTSAAAWYGDDIDCPAWGEPGGDDFLSSALIEAEAMRRLLPADAFAAWFGRFLPRLSEGHPATLFMPALATDRSDGKIAHLDGLNLSRAWCLRALAKALPSGDPRLPPMLEAADRHYEAAMPHLAGEYMGEHWLASFALLALDG
ncbi:DUF2891 domain-containing protein [Methylobacterium sp. J-067]|uniref:DUF2891 domain-containing protein n=1 Tax=Methylobacterium sp. J-067 TaxID=2836648 RepID=UPI001FB924C1|nr:DUF2891 domain-containing protein [Methylobacterium sp. J-067]MCJ2027781.1 DUF2891 domain-containing protein [Methylobacterium sp. J-067]